MRWNTSIPSAACVVLALQSIGVHATQQKPLGAAGPGGSSSKNPFTGEFAELAKETLDEWHCAGIAISVVDGDDIFAQGYGFATLPDVPATPETLWYVGSTTKAHTAAAVAQLIDSGDHPALSRGWKTPISSIIREDFVLQDAWSTDHITLEDAVSHRTGFTRHDASYLEFANNTPHGVRDTVRNMRNLPLHLEPRVEFHYSNLMFTVLTHVVESVTGRWLGHVLKDSIWGPLGMNSTYMDLQQAKDAPEHLSTGYYWHEGEERLKPIPFVPTAPLNGAGAIISNVLDYAKWVKSLLRRSGPLSEAVHREIRTPRMIQNPEPGMGVDATLYSLAWFRTTIHGQVAYWHSGSVGTHGALVYWFPDLDYGVIIFANFPSPVRQVLMWRLIEDKLRIPKDRRFNVGAKMREAEHAARHEISNATNILFPDRPKNPLPPSLNLSDFEGTYRNQGYGSIKLARAPFQSSPGASSLVAKRDSLLWKDELELHHVSGDFWTVYIVDADGPPGPQAFYEGHFTVGADGKAAALAVTVFDRAEMVYEGTIVYDKIA